MEQKATAAHRSLRRIPLAEQQPRTGPPSTSSKASAQSKIPSPPCIAHHESARSAGIPSVISRQYAPSPPPAKDRGIAIHADHIEPSKRDSQISTLSTNSNSKGKRKTHIGPWQLGRTLGKGATGRVRLAKHALTGQIAAIKIVSKKSAAMVSSASMRQMDNDAILLSNMSGVRTMPFGIEREIVILKLIEHPNIISLYDIWENRGELYLVLEYVEGGELFEYIYRNGALPEAEAARLLRQLLAGLAYCHRFNICHRDLKPENILLDADHNIKIADFGMAAMQPVGKYLSTACGSPHYAAPEIIAGKQYRGNQCDIWSAGIILYAMVHGFLPFNGKDMQETLDLVRKGEYYLSPRLSDDATDLIQNMLQKHPRHRISMAQLWRHPFLTKYERLHATMAAPHSLAGPPPPLTPAECGPKKIHADDIDSELLRNLQVLWHGLPEKELIARLTSNEPNYEKLFYWGLVRFRDEQLENYPGESLQYSASDYHHVKPPAPRLPTLYQRRNSQFSIVSEGSTTRAAYYKNPAVAASKITQASYDPYRASRTSIAHGSGHGTTVVVRRGATSVSIQPLPDLEARYGSHDEGISAFPDLPSLDAHEVQAALSQKRSAYSAVSSQSSLASSQRPRKFKRSASYRRNVSFQHQRCRSNHTNNASKYSSLRVSISRPATRESNQNFSDSRSTPSMPTPSRVAQPKRPASDLDFHSACAAHMPWRDDARKVSAELSKICEEAFNRSSVSCASDTTGQDDIDSPAATVSPPAAVIAKIGKGRIPAITAALQDLIERRQRMVDTWGNGDAQTLVDLVGTLDRRIAEEERRLLTAVDQRLASDPTHDRPRSGVDTSSTLVTVEDLKRGRESDLRAVTDPVRSQDKTIRIVTPDPSSPGARVTARPNKAIPINSFKDTAPHLDRGRDIYDKRLLAGQHLDPIMEDPPNSPKKQHLVEKKWSWLGKKAVTSHGDVPPTPPRKDSPKQKQPMTISNASSASIESRQDTHSFEEMEAKKRGWFRKVFALRKKAKTLAIDSDHKVVPDDEDLGSVQDLFAPSSRTPWQRGHGQVPGMEGATNISAASRYESGQNWFAKFLHLKPATSILVMQASKATARKEIVKVLREWQKFGIRDVAVERRPTGDIVRARVDATNYLRIRPVQFVASVYTVLERGRPAKLSIVKFTQEQGAASSFHKVVDTIESVMKENGVILEDAEKRKKIMKSMKQARI